MSDTISLADLGIDEDPGTAWHPRPDKTEARDADGLLLDLDDDAVAEHMAKPEAAEQPDAGLSLSAEDSALTPDGEV
ncbi:MAG TPA: hypothetical protein VIQ11_07295 [Mycobacterium sp.]